MFNANELFKTRFIQFMKETSRYLKYMLNGHIMVAMLFLIVALAVYYQQWLAQLPDNFPSAWVIGLLFGFIASYHPVRTLLKQPDIVFIIPAERNMDTYFRKSLIFSYVYTIFLSLFVVAAVSPLYFHSFAERKASSYLWLIVILFLFKVGNLLANWWMLKISDKRTRFIDQFVRFLLNSANFFFLISHEMILASVTTILMAGIIVYDYYLSAKEPGIAWELLIEKDQKQMQAFYRIANLFTDVPHIKPTIKKRQWLVSIVKRLPFMHKYTYDYLYRIAFARSNDYLGMYIRLTIIGGLIIYFIPHLWMKVLFALLFLYLTAIQLTTLYYHFRTNMWLDIYPIDQSLQKQAVIKLLFQLILIQSIIFCIVPLIMLELEASIMIIGGGLIGNYLFTRIYLPRKFT